MEDVEEADDDDVMDVFLSRRFRSVPEMKVIAVSHFLD